MKNNDTSIQDDSLSLLLDGSDPVLAILREQFRCASLSRRQTGAGFVVDFTVPDNCTRIPGNPTFRFGDVVASVEGNETAIGFVLFVVDGAIAMFEGYTFDACWPDGQFTYSLRYDPSSRDLAWTRRYME